MYPHIIEQQDTKKVESNGKPLQLGLSLAKLAQSHQFTIKKRCVRKIKSDLLACIKSKFSTFFILKNVRKIKKTLKTSFTSMN